MMRSSRVMRVSASLMRGRPSGHWPSKLSLAAATARRERSARSSSEPASHHPREQRSSPPTVRAASPTTSTRRNFAERAIDPDFYHNGRWLEAQGWCAIRAGHVPRGSRAHRQLPAGGSCTARRRDRVVLHAALRLGADLRRAARRRRRPVHRSAPRRRAWACSATCANTNVLETRFEAPEGAFRVLDFAPRFVQYDRSFRPTKLVRIVEPLAGTPRIRVSLRPGARLVEGAAAARSRLAPHQLSRLPGGGAAHHRRAAVLPRWRAVRAHRAQALRLLLGRAGRGSAGAVVRALPQRDRRLLADVGEALRRAVDLPGGSDPVGAGAEAPLLRGHRRDRRGADDVDPGVGRLGADVGLPLLLAARRLLRPRRVPPARPLRGARAVHPLPAERRLGRARTRSRAALSHRRPHRSGGVDPHALARLRGRAAGAGRQRRGAAQAARRVRRDGAGADAAVPRRALPRAGDAAGARSGHASSRAGPSPSPARPTPASGSCGPSGVRRPSARSCAGRPRIA